MSASNHVHEMPTPYTEAHSVVLLPHAIPPKLLWSMPMGQYTQHAITVHPRAQARSDARRMAAHARMLPVLRTSLSVKLEEALMVTT